MFREDLLNYVSKINNNINNRFETFSGVCRKDLDRFTPRNKNKSEDRGNNTSFVNKNLSKKTKVKNINQVSLK